MVTEAPTEAELIRNRDKKRNNKLRIRNKQQEEWIAKVEKERDIAVAALEAGGEVEVEEVGSVKAHEIYKALGTMAVLKIMVIDGGYYLELSEKRYRELVGGNDEESGE